MPRPKNADAAATRARVLARAAELFAARGFGSTSVRDIAAAAEVSLATVHHYFGSKDELYAASIDAMYEELSTLRGELQEMIQSAEEPLALIDLAVRRTYQFVREHLAAHKLVLRSVIDTGEVPEERREDFLLPLLADTAVIIAAVTGQEQERVALTLHSLNQLIVRYALIAPAEARWIAGAIESAQDPQQMLEDHLVYCARALLQLPI